MTWPRVRPDSNASNSQSPFTLFPCTFKSSGIVVDGIRFPAFPNTFLIFNFLFFPFLLLFSSSSSFSIYSLSRCRFLSLRIYQSIKRAHFFIKIDRILKSVFLPSVQILALTRARASPSCCLVVSDCALRWVLEEEKERETSDQRSRA